MKKKGRGLSYDQKRDKMLRIFHDSRTVFNYEEIQKLSIKAGIPFPNVKEILNSLKADSLVECEKIGSGVFYWSFPSKALQIFESKITFSEQQIIFYSAQVEKLTQQLKQGQIGRQQSEQRQQLLNNIAELESEKQQLQNMIDKLIRFDPERVELLKKQNEEIRRGINLQTDNLEQIRKFFKKNQPGIKDFQIQENYGIPADLDYC